MGRYVTIEFSDGTQIGGGWRGKCDFPGTFVFKPGDKCVVQPPNSKRKSTEVVSVVCLTLTVSREA
jgi:hypothetical protein